MGEKCEICTYFLSKAVRDIESVFRGAYERRITGRKEIIDLKEKLESAGQYIETLKNQGCISSETAINKAIKSKDVEEIEDIAFDVKEDLILFGSSEVADACQKSWSE